MTKKTFSAEQWFRKNIDSPRSVDKTPSLRIDACPVADRFPKFIRISTPTPSILKLKDFDRFSPVNCFVPGWKGDSLSSKTVLKFENLLNIVQQDIKNELFKAKDFPRTIKMGLYSEFLLYAGTLGLNFEGLDDFGSFWQLIDPDKLSEEKSISEFIDLYSNRVATMTFFKLRFISSLLDNCGLDLIDKALLYPTSFLSQIFKQGSTTELNSRALESNLYSWYRPHEGMKEIMRDLLILSKELSITEIIKNVSQRTQVAQDQQKVYSHALSHVSLGLFLNSLQINFPMWLETVEGSRTPIGNIGEEEIISCKYFGDYLESMSLSHWLAQENNQDFHWDQMLCPDFKGNEFFAGQFSKICNEIQFLTFLANKAVYQNEKPIDYICKIMRGHLNNRKDNQGFKGLLEDNDPFYSSTYDRVVLNLCHFPKNNPQHFLMTQILEQVKYLKPNGYLFVLSSKKLFVPSLRERLEPVLRELSTEAILDFENVKGKGELGSYVYIFRKKQKKTVEKQQCSYFRISANLESFQQFSSITEHLRTFYLSHLNEVPPMAHLDFPDSFRIEFYQEAVVNGMLIHSTSEDSSRITHPAYFKGLLDSCIPLDTLFEIKSLSIDEKPSTRDSLNLRLKRDPAYFLIVDFRQSEVNLELHPMDTYRSIHSDYGETQCSYFQLQPKIQGLNPNILRNYFLTPVGKQVAHLTFSGGPSLVKGSLSKFLVPKFMTQSESLPDHLKSGFDIFDMDEEQFLEASPEAVLKSFSHINQISIDLFPRYACEILSRFSTLESTLQSLIWKMDDSRYGHKISFGNPLIQAQLVQKPTRPLYPENEDIFIEFVDGTSPSDIHLDLHSLQMRVQHEADIKLYCLELVSSNKTVVRMHAEEPMILFLHFILAQASNVPISKILRAVYVPSLKDLKTVIDTSQSFKSSYQMLLDQVQKSITEAMRIHVTPKRNP